MRFINSSALFVAVVLAFLCGFNSVGALAQGAPVAAPPWGPGGGTVDPKDPNLWHNPKDGPSDYVWNAKICRWVYKDGGKDAVGTHKAGDLASQGPPTGAKLNPGAVDRATNPTTGDTFTWGDDKPDPKNPNGPPVPGSGNGWVNDKTNTKLCPPGAPVAVAPGGVKVAPAFNVSFGVGGTILVPNVKVGWQGTGTGGGVSNTFNNLQVMPTVEIDTWYNKPVAQVGSFPLFVGGSANLMVPTGGTNSKAVSSGGFNGTETFKQGMAGSAFVNVGTDLLFPFVTNQLGFDTGLAIANTSADPFACPAQSGTCSLNFYGSGAPAPAPQKPQQSLIVFAGVGVGMNQYQAGAVFPTANDNFGTGTQTNFVPAFQVGVATTGAPYLNGGGLDLFVQDFLPGSAKTMPGGNAVSYGTAKAGNTISVTFKATIPLGGVTVGSGN